MEFRGECERCHLRLPPDASAYLCAEESTFCPKCYRELWTVCPKCSGELVRRPRAGPPRETVTGPPPPKNRSIRVRRAGPRDVAAVAPLFDAYRQFYRQPPASEASRQFLADRLARNESVVFVAEYEGSAVGFVQLYPLFSSVTLGRVYLLNDLYVLPSARRQGVGAHLLEAAREWGEREGAHYLELSTAVDNPAQLLYEGCGWRPDREFLYYELPLPASGRPATGGDGAHARSERSPGPG